MEGGDKVGTEGHDRKEGGYGFVRGCDWERRGLRDRVVWREGGREGGL